MSAPRKNSSWLSHYVTAWADYLVSCCDEIAFPSHRKYAKTPNRFTCAEKNFGLRWQTRLYQHKLKPLNQPKPLVLWGLLMLCIRALKRPKVENLGTECARG